MSPADALDADAIRAGLAGQLIGNRVVALESVASTNDVAAQMAAKHSEGLVVFAEQQTAGRGQYGRRWESAVGKGLWMSVLLRPRIAIGDSARLTAMLAEAIAAAILETLGITAAIKPPNDVYIGGRKVAGVLVEMRAEPGGGYCAIAGMGVNVNHTPEDFPIELRASAGSLATASGHRVDRTAFAAALLQQLEMRYGRLARGATTPAPTG